MMHKQEELLQRFPWAESKDRNGCGRGHLAPCWCGDGWYTLIYSMFEEIENLFIAGDRLVDLQVYEIKEKYGEMRVSIGSSLQEVYNIVDTYEVRSSKVCEECGEEGKIRDINGWLSVNCDSCYQKQL
ncbi:hypothetical protein NST84_09860 [Paenibacillus sp. FSL R7-0345]|uniref:hypothetical protein n=1 Tax=Paenibacillus sp. FSL R7-0345 TaxID=2954535 RepID=UPI00315A3506